MLCSFLYLFSFRDLQIVKFFLGFVTLHQFVSVMWRGSIISYGITVSSFYIAAELQFNLVCYGGIGLAVGPAMANMKTNVGRMIYIVLWIAKPCL